MAHFVVRFLKDVVGDQGQLCEACQRTIDVDARDETEATLLAKQEFCKCHGNRDWSLHADRIDVKPAPQLLTPRPRLRKYRSLGQYACAPAFRSLRSHAGRLG